MGIRIKACTQITLILLCVSLSSGCASAIQSIAGAPTPYRTEFELLGSWHGTRARPIDEDSYLITTNVNQFTSPEIMTEYNLLRSAKLAEEKGFSHFVVEVDESDSVKLYGYKNRLTQTTTVVGHNFLSELQIRLSNAPDEQKPSFVASKIIAELGPRYLK